VVLRFLHVFKIHILSSDFQGKRVEENNMTPPKDFFWSNDQEPHVQRRKEILTKYGKEVKQLMGPESKTKFIAVSVTITQVLLGIFVAPYISSWLSYLLLAYVVGATLSHNLFLAIHEITHNLAFRKPLHNDMLAMFCNIPLVLPYAMMFKTYHAEHHRYQGWDGVDTDIPAPIEAKLLSNFFGKLFFLVFQVAFYALRPTIVRPITINKMHVVNYAVIIPIQISLIYFFGFGPIGFWALSTVLACSLHPMAGHFIAEHYVFDGKGKQETFSYYGPLNFFGYNVGYHNEHHDFPNVPWSRLEGLKQAAPEFYNTLETCPSWPGTLVRFLFNSDMNSYCRVKRELGAWKRTRMLSTCEPSSPTTLSTKDE
jgi:sphingolipid 4-desaturase/C4-monooxygenase